ncbi:hypothetical protein CC80DRAFT_116273 [Byssothecium circinans]|uniref:Heterokaryon incompatibility domain-containing protein n=1 Tax=Byssothecium circinans TaxID=147558 RepID=A0A6A5TS45_9PLEO|nr:hypothetical protein CC80DRAFT_116273 [Byssothecium circinans]
MGDGTSKQTIRQHDYGSQPRLDVYEHLPLNVAQKEIRLLEILNTEPMLECKLSRVSLYASPEFIAISYTWESGLPLVQITLNGYEFSIRENLHNALVQFNSSAPGTCFWVDAICIDQSCIPERNAQVPLMRDIYSSASRVWVWLGDGTHRTEALVSLIHTLPYIPGTFKDYTPLSEIGDLVSFIAYRESWKHEAEEWDYLFNRLWFNRTWVRNSKGSC